MSSHALGFGDGFTVNAYTNHPPAIIQKAEVKNCAWWKHHLGQLAIEVTTKAKEYRAAVKQFKDSGSWQKEYTTWAKCSREVLGISPQRANQLIREITESWVDESESPLSESQATQTEKTDEKALKQVEKAREAKPTTEKAKAEPEPAIVDKVGRTIPPYALDYWRRSSEVQHVLSALSDLRTTIRKANESGDRLWCAFDTQDLLLSFDALYTSVANFMPHAVCKKCNGVETKTLCSMCHGTGLINKTTYGFNKS